MGKADCDSKYGVHLKTNEYRLQEKLYSPYFHKKMICNSIEIRQSHRQVLSLKYDMKPTVFS